MGLESAMNTALTGMSASETSIDVIGNNLANANTVGFKESDVDFATQFLQTLTVGSAAPPQGSNAPTAGESYGTDPEQSGLGTEVEAIAPNFSQGTIQTSTNPTNLAIQGEGFFVVTGEGGQQLYTRDGSFQLNANAQLTTTTGNAVLGLQADAAGAFNQTANSKDLTPITIALGQSLVAQATSTVNLEGTLSPTGNLATASEILQSGVLGDASYVQPNTQGTTPTTANPSPVPSVTGATAASTDDSTMTSGLTGGDTYSYELVAVDNVTGSQGMPSAPISVTLASGDNEVALSNLPAAPAGNTWDVYRANTTSGPGTYRLVGSVAPSTTTYTDSAADASLTTAANPDLNQTLLNGSYSYYVTFTNASGVESRPSAVVSAEPIVNGRIELQDIPTPPVPLTNYTSVNIYRNTAGENSQYYQLAQIHVTNSTPTTLNYTDSMSDQQLVAQNTTTSAGGATTVKTLNMNGPGITGSTAATDVLQLNGSSYTNLFHANDVLNFTPNVGGSNGTTESMTIGSGTTVADILSFMNGAMGILTNGSPVLNGATLSHDTSGALPGYSINNGQIEFVSNEGTANAIAIGSSALQVTNSSGTTAVNLGFNTLQSATGTSASTSVVAYDALGNAVNVQLTAVLQSTSAEGTFYRWYATSPNNNANLALHPNEFNTCVGTGLLAFDSSGNLISPSPATGSVTINQAGANGTLQFNLDFSKLSGLAATTDSLAVTTQDGAPPGTLNSFTVGNDGMIRGVFSNGVTQDLAQVVLAQFSNPAGLEQQGQNLYASGVNSGNVVLSNPGQNGAGSIVGGATELSNTDVGSNLVDLILASTMYRGNAQVVTTVQQLYQTLLTLNTA